MNPEPISSETLAEIVVAAEEFTTAYSLLREEERGADLARFVALQFRVCAAIDRLRESTGKVSAEARRNLAHLLRVGQAPSVDYAAQLISGPRLVRPLREGDLDELKRRMAESKLRPKK
jgi:hypothetical protein